MAATSTTSAPIAEVRGYYPLTKQFTLVGRAIGGTIQGWDGQDVRIVDDFYKGGETIRGFATAGIGPRDPTTGKSYGGKTFYAGTTEIRFPLPFVPDDLGFGGAVFADAGTLYGTDAASFAAKFCAKSTNAATCAATPFATPEDSDGIRSSVGGSIIWNSPIGPLRADFAWALTKEYFDQTQVFRFGAATKF